MKLLESNYIFNPVGQTIVFLDYTVINLQRVLLITDTTNNTIIYNFADPTRGGYAIGNVLTLNYNTSSLGANDALQIFYDVDEMQLQDFQQQNSLLRRMIQIVQSLSTIDASGRQRINIDQISVPLNIGNISTVNTLTTMPGAAGNPTGFSVGITGTVSNVILIPTPNVPSTSGLFVIPEIWKTVDIARDAYANCIRRNLTFS